VLGVIAALIGVAGAPAWVIGVAVGALLAIAIAPLQRAVLKWPTDMKACIIAGMIVVISGAAGWLIGNATSDNEATGTSNQADIKATGYINGKWIEQEAEIGAEAFAAPGVEATKSGHRIPPLAFVHVTCRIYVSGVPSAHPDGYWYRLPDKPWKNKDYVAANTFWNGSNIVKGPGVKNTDTKVPVCK
jgi:hypothetical protein